MYLSFCFSETVKEIFFYSEADIIMLDAGAEAWQQMVKFFGMEEAKRVLRKVKAVFVSHLHGDHMLVSLRIQPLSNLVALCI